MIPKEKAKDLANKFLRTYKVSLFPPFNSATEEAKQCALIAVDEILGLGYSRPFWEEVKEEISKL